MRVPINRGFFENSSVYRQETYKSTERESNIVRVIYDQRLHAFSWPDAFVRIGAYDLKACSQRRKITAL